MRRVHVVGAAAAVAITGMLFSGAIAVGDYGLRGFMVAVDHYRWWWTPLFTTVWTTILFVTVFTRSRLAPDASRAAALSRVDLTSTPKG